MININPETRNENQNKQTGVQMQNNQKKLEKRKSSFKIFYIELTIENEHRKFKERRYY